MPKCIRNDDVAFDTDVAHLKQFNDICDRYGFRVLQAITLRGICRPIDVKMTNEEIKRLSNASVFENTELIDYLKSRNDIIGVHGFWHTHEPSEQDILLGKIELEACGFTPTYFVTPFNEGSYPEIICDLKVSQHTDRLESFLDEGTPTSDIVYLHSWRFDGSWYTLEQLEKCMQRITTLS